MASPIERVNPPYAQIAAEIRRQIYAGELQPGDFVPSARKIATTWRVSLATATKVLAALRSAGLVESQPGIGTVVSRRRESNSEDEPPSNLAATTRHSVSVAAVVTNEHGRVLVIRRTDNGAWQLPGGVLELEESIEDGVRRETREETGVEITPERLTGVYKNVKLGVVALVFRARWTSGTARPTDEAAEVAWWTPDEVQAEMVEAFAVRVLDGLRADSPPAVRIHDGVRLLG